MQVTTIIFLLISWLPDSGYKFNPVPRLRHKFIVIAHRGDHTIYPENTLQAYGQAIKKGADYIEIDLRTTSDGELVSLHDATVTRMAGGKGLIRDMTLEQVESLKISVKNNPDTALYRIPTFDQILKLCRHKIHLYIDFKEADATVTYQMLKQYHMEKEALVYINRPSQFIDWRKSNPGMPLMVSLPDSVKNLEAMKSFISKYHPDVLDGNYSGYDSTMVSYAKSVNLKVWPDVQSPAEGPAVWDKAIALGFTGLQTDNPPALIKYLKDKGLR